MGTIKLHSSDGVIIDVDREVATFMLKDSNLVEAGQDVASIPNVNSEVLTLIIKWTKHQIKKDQLKSEDDANSFEEKFLNELDLGTLFELTLAANYLGIKELIAATCKHINKIFEGKTEEEIRNIVRIQDEERLV